MSFRLDGPGQKARCGRVTQGPPGDAVSHRPGGESLRYVERGMSSSRASVRGPHELPLDAAQAGCAGASRLSCARVARPVITAPSPPMRPAASAASAQPVEDQSIPKA
jgi:hypothetical protein